MKNPNPINLRTSAEIRKAGWQAETRDADGHLCRTHSPFETDEDIVWLVREAMEHGETVTIWPRSKIEDTPSPQHNVVGVEAAWQRYTHGGKPSIWGREVFEAGFRAARAPAPSEHVVVDLDDDTIVRLARGHLDQNTFASATYGKSSPLYPQDSYTVPTYGLKQFVKAIRAALSFPVGGGE